MSDKVTGAAMRAGRAIRESLDDSWGVVDERLAVIIDRETRLPQKEAALRPFAHPDLRRILSGNTEGDKSIVFRRNEAKLTIGDFKRAAAALAQGD